MELHDTLENDMRQALKGGNTVKLSVLRMVVSAVKTAEIDKKVKRLDEADILQIIQKQVKQHKESIDQFNKGNRGDLVDKETAELKILETYMPEQLNEQELSALVKEAIEETGAATKADTGKVMKAVMAKAKGRADGKAINQIVMGLLK